MLSYMIKTFLGEQLKNIMLGHHIIHVYKEEILSATKIVLDLDWSKREFDFNCNDNEIKMLKNLKSIGKNSIFI